MITKIYAVIDIKAGNYSTPFFAASNGLAIRMFADVVRDPKTTLSRHPDDFQLFYLGDFDDNSGELISAPKPQFLSKAIEFINAEKPLSQN